MNPIEAKMIFKGEGFSGLLLYVVQEPNGYYFRVTHDAEVGTYKDRDYTLDYAISELEQIESDCRNLRARIMELKGK